MHAFWTDIKHGPVAPLWPLYVSRKPLTAKGYPGQRQPGWPGLHREERERYRERREGAREMEKWEERACTVQLCPKAITASHWAPGVVHSHATTGTVTASQSWKQIPTYTKHSDNTLLYFSSCRLIYFRGFFCMFFPSFPPEVMVGFHTAGLLNR